LVVLTNGMPLIFFFAGSLEAENDLMPMHRDFRQGNSSLKLPAPNGKAAGSHGLRERAMIHH
jgi:hypothetical protein